MHIKMTNFNHLIFRLCKGNTSLKFLMKLRIKNYNKIYKCLATYISDLIGQGVIDANISHLESVVNTVFSSHVANGPVKQGVNNRYELKEPTCLVVLGL